MLIPLLKGIHVLSIVIWIGGVAFVTMVVFPMIMQKESHREKINFFLDVEHRFAMIAKFSILIAGVTGVWLLYITGRWVALFTVHGLDITLMLLVWSFYVFVLLFESLIFKKIFKEDAHEDTKKIFLKMTIFHWIILSLSLLTVFIGVLIGHGFYFKF